MKGPLLVWIKTDEGRAEMQSRALVKERSRRNLLLLIDGARSEAMLLEQVAGISSEDFDALEALGLIIFTDGSRGAASPPSVPGALSASGAARAAPIERTLPMPLDEARPSAPADLPAAPPQEPAREGPADYAGFTTALSQLISKQLGLRGFTLVLAVEKASTPQELLQVAERVVAAIRERKGDAAADAARATLFGG